MAVFFLNIFIYICFLVVVSLSGNQKPDSTPMKIALLVPCYNESKTIKKVIEDFRKQISDIEIYVYDNNSSDDTYDLAKANGAIVRKEYRQGKGHVVRSMFEEIEADIYIMVDGDDTYPASFVKELIAPVVNGDADMVVGDRLTNGSYYKENKRRFHDLGNNLVRTMVNLIFQDRLTDIMTGYRVFNRRFVKSLPVLSSGFQVETEMTIFALDKKFKIVEIPIDFQERPEGSFSKLNTFTDGRKVLWEIFSLFRHYKPLPFFSIIASLFLIASLLVGTPVILEYVREAYVYKVPSAVLAAILGAVSVILFNTGIILDTIATNDKKSWLYKKKNLRA